MNNPTKTRRLPVMTRIHPGGTTEVFYGVTCDVANLPATSCGCAALRRPDNELSGLLSRSNTYSLSTVARSATATTF